MAKQDEDNKTIELPLKRGRGRPRLYANGAEKQAAYRTRHNLRVLTIEMPADVYADFDAWCAKRAMDADISKAEVVVNLIKKQLLRKR